MTPSEMFDEAMEVALGERRDLIAFLRNVSETQARWLPPDGEWSILQGLEHILLTDAWVRENLASFLRDAEANDRWDNAPAQPQKMTLEALRRREQGFVPAPEHLLPQGRQDFARMQEELMPSRLAFREALLPFRERDFSRLVPPATRYGELNVYERIHYAGIHDYLHREQMERVTRQPGFPPK